MLEENGADGLLPGEVDEFFMGLDRVRRGRGASEEQSTEGRGAKEASSAGGFGCGSSVEHF